MAQKHLDFRKAMMDPRAEFGVPERLLADPRLDREGKRAILRNWEQDERELAVAEEEGMMGGERSMLQRVVQALDTISEGRGPGSGGATKHGGSKFGPDGDADDGPAVSRVREIMRPVDEVVHTDQTLHDAFIRMRQVRTSFLPVVDGDEIVGIVTARDIYGKGESGEANIQAAKVGDHLSREIAFCYDDDDLATATLVVRESGRRRLLVVDRDHQLVGLVTLERIAAALGRQEPGSSPAAAPRKVGKRLARTRSRAKGGEPGKIEVYAVRPKIKR